MALNIFGKSSWATKITSLLVEGEYTQYDSTDYLTANGANEWVIAEMEGATRENIATQYLEGDTFNTFFKGADDLTGVTYGTGLVVGTGSLIRPGTTLGNQVYIGANCVIDIDCVIGNNVTINDGVVIQAGAVVEEGTNIMSGSVVS